MPGEAKLRVGIDTDAHHSPLFSIHGIAGLVHRGRCVEYGTVGIVLIVQ